MNIFLQHEQHNVKLVLIRYGRNNSRYRAKPGQGLLHWIIGMNAQGEKNSAEAIQACT